MHMESFLHPREKEVADYYPNLPRETVFHAESYLKLVEEGVIRAIGMDKDEVKGVTARLKSGKLEEHYINDYALNYADYVNKTGEAK